MPQKILKFILIFFAYAGPFALVYGILRFWKKPVDWNELIISTLFFGAGMMVYEVFILKKKKRKDSH